MKNINNVKNKKIIFETDWLASNSYFYNSKTGLNSKKINDTITSNDEVKFNKEGLYNYLDYGYSVFGQTPLENVKFMKPSSRLIKLDNGELLEEKLPDPLEKFIDYKLSENDLIELIQERVQKWESKVPKRSNIILPLSGGFDSRLLLWCLKDKDRINSYTYGLSEDQSKSTETVHARKLAELYNLNWSQVKIGNFHSYIRNWYNEFGISTHTHGMYHFEFYNKIRNTLKGEHSFLSGIFGDVFAGNVKTQKIESSDQLIKLGYVHGLCANPSKLKINCEFNLRDKFWMENKENLKDYRYQIITTIRLKIMLISYLIKIPSLFSFNTWSPYLDIDIAMAMLNLPKERRLNRKWQIDFFKKNNLYLEGQNLKSDNKNLLNLVATLNQPLIPLDAKLLSSLIDEDYVIWINKNIKLNNFNKFKGKLFRIPKLSRIFKELGFQSFWNAYSAYLTLKPLEMFLKK